MAESSYTTDLQTVSLADAMGTWVEIPSRKSGGAATLEDRAYIQGDYCISQSTGTATGRTCGLQFDYGGNISGWVSGWVFLIWQFWQAPKAMGVWADGGMRLGVGSGPGDVNLWNTQGNDYGRNPYGGFANVAIDPEYTQDEKIGTPTVGNYRYFWSAPYLLSGVSKGNPHCVDAIRYGRGEVKFRGGNDSSADRCTFAGMAAANDADSARWGLFQEQFGAYLWKGLMSFGIQNDSSSATEDAVDFDDANRVILIDDMPRTYASFNRIEINDVDSIVNWTSITFISLCTLSPGQLEVIDNADVNFDGCSFTDMNTFIFQSNSSILNSIFQACGLITAAGADFDGSKVLESSVAADASALNWNVATDPDGLLDNMTFSKGANAHHAIEFGITSPLTMTLRGMTTSGFNSSNAQNDSTFHVKRTSGNVTINIVDGTGNFSYKTAGAAVSIIVNPITLRITVQDEDTDPIQNAQVAIYKTSDRTQLMNEDTTALGVAEEAYSGSAVDIEIRVRKSSIGATKYIPFSTLGATGTSDYNLLVTLKEDTNA